MTAPEVRVVEDRHQALNASDVDLLVALSHPDVAVGGPRGTGQGTQLLREWVARAGIHVEPQRAFHRAETVVVEGNGEWRDGSGEVTGSGTVGSVFVVQGGRVSRVIRYPDLTSALVAAGLDESYETRPDG